MPQVQWRSLAEGKAWAQAFTAQLQRPCVILLSGGLGAGKTQLVRWWLEALGGGEAASPTFAIHHRYATPSGPVDHVDLYRLTSDADLESSGFWDLLQNDSALLFVEWSERLPVSAWPAGWTKIELKIGKDPAHLEGRRLDITRF